MILNNWHFVCGTYASGGDLVVYVDGAEKGRTTPSGAYADISAPFQIGVGASGEAWNGKIDEVRIYNRALSASEVSSLFQGTISPPVLDTTPPAAPSNLLVIGATALWEGISRFLANIFLNVQGWLGTFFDTLLGR